MHYTLHFNTSVLRFLKQKICGFLFSRGIERRTLDRNGLNYKTVKLLSIKQSVSLVNLVTGIRILT